MEKIYGAIVIEHGKNATDRVFKSLSRVVRAVSELDDTDEQL